MSYVKITIGNEQWTAKLEEEKAPATCKAFRSLLPYQAKVIHVRWSGEGLWAPLGDFNLGIDFENHTTYPSKGEILFYPGKYSETEILIPYGSCQFTSRVGPLAGNHFMTIEKDLDQLEKLGREILWHGAKDILFETYLKA